MAPHSRFQNAPRAPGEPSASATWEHIDSFTERYPSFQLEDELLVEGGEMSCGADSTAAGLRHEVQPGQLPRARMAWKKPRRLRRLEGL
jgi:hypothetical protein